MDGAPDPDALIFCRLQLPAHAYLKHKQESLGKYIWPVELRPVWYEVIFKIGGTPCRALFHRRRRPNLVTNLLALFLALPAFRHLTTVPALVLRPQDRAAQAS